MFDQLNQPDGAEVTGDRVEVCRQRPLSFRKKRRARRQGRLLRRREKSLSLKDMKGRKSRQENNCPGPTAETKAKLTADPLIRFKRQNILDDEQIWAFMRIRRAINIITDNSRMRISRFNIVAVQSSHFFPQHQNESDYEIRLKDHYSRWIDHMTQARQQAGPILDIIIDEMSLTAVDRKWGRRKGWAKNHLQAALDLYSKFLAPKNRDK